MKTASLCTTLLLFASQALAGHAQPERYWQERVCSTMSGEAEHRLFDATRVDCLTADHAIEFDFAVKWAESLGQALYYASRTGKRAGIAIIKEDDGDQRYIERLQHAIAFHGLPVDVWVVRGY